MRAVIQCVLRAAVSVAGEQVAGIGPGMVVLLGIARDDDAATAARLAERVTGLRIFDDGAGRMNLDLGNIGGAMLCISQFTLYGDVRRGRRPSFEAAAPAAQAQPLYEAFVATVRGAGIPCATGVFGAEMQVELVNDGPVTLILDSADLERPRRA